jgi:hypothetical protein
MNYTVEVTDRLPLSRTYPGGDASGTSPFCAITHPPSLSFERYLLREADPCALMPATATHDDLELQIGPRGPRARSSLPPLGMCPSKLTPGVSSVAAPALKISGA